MKFHPRNGHIVARQLKDGEINETGISLLVIQEKRPVDFVIVVESMPDSEYKQDDILAINPMLAIAMGWLANNYIVFPEHQVLAVVETEANDKTEGEEYDKENPVINVNIVKPGVC